MNDHAVATEYTRIAKRHAVASLRIAEARRTEIGRLLRRAGRRSNVRRYLVAERQSASEEVRDAKRHLRDVVRRIARWNKTSAADRDVRR